mmetsp:Transcript_100095/g.317941  ORF Transcript_100095/g.317941 Transcript_100095/m.317941 type:complete len:119 (+) Transcript_100095:2-358(+)
MRVHAPVPSECWRMKRKSASGSEPPASSCGLAARPRGRRQLAKKSWKRWRPENKSGPEEPCPAMKPGRGAASGPREACGRALPLAQLLDERPLEHCGARLSRNQWRRQEMEVHAGCWA